MGASERPENGKLAVFPGNRVFGPPQGCLGQVPGLVWGWSQASDGPIQGSQMAHLGVHFPVWRPLFMAGDPSGAGLGLVWGWSRGGPRPVWGPDLALGPAPDSPYEARKRDFPGKRTISRFRPSQRPRYGPGTTPDRPQMAKFWPRTTSRGRNLAKFGPGSTPRWPDLGLGPPQTGLGPPPDGHIWAWDHPQMARSGSPASPGTTPASPGPAPARPGTTPGPAPDGQISGLEATFYGWGGQISGLEATFYGWGPQIGPPTGPDRSAGVMYI